MRQVAMHAPTKCLSVAQLCEVKIDCEKLKTLESFFIHNFRIHNRSDPKFAERFPVTSPQEHCDVIKRIVNLFE